MYSTSGSRQRQRQRVGFLQIKRESEKRETMNG